MNCKGLASVVLLATAAAGLAGWRLTVVHGSTAPDAAGPQSWNGAAAASYLDSRELWWQQWPRAKRDHGTVCISCHTQVPYALVRPKLQGEVGEPSAPAPEKMMMQNVEYRVSHWTDMVPFYPDAPDGPERSAESHATEAVLNAIILTSYDAQQGTLRPVTRTALDSAWALQQQSGPLAGGWRWQNFHLAPWESNESGYQGAAMLLMEVEKAPGGYAGEPAHRAQLEALRSYLRRGYSDQPVVNQLYVLWAAGADRGPHSAELLSTDQRKSLLKRIQNLQRDDGGWSLSSMDIRGWRDLLRPTAASDGYATGLAVLVLEGSGVEAHDATLHRGLAWLTGHQQKAGNWVATSLNEQQDPESEIGKFMSDAATGYAVLALQNAGIRPIR